MRVWQQSEDPYVRFAGWEEWTRNQLSEYVCKEFDESSFFPVATVQSVL